MASLVDEQSTSDFVEIEQKVLQQMKTYIFFIYYEKEVFEHQQPIDLQKLDFKLREEKGTSNEKYADHAKNIQLLFYDLNDEYEVRNSLIYLKSIRQQNKTKIIFYAREQALLNFILNARIYSLNVQNIPLCIYTKDTHSDLARYLGWSEYSLNLRHLSVAEAENDVRKWVGSPTEKIDLWSVQMKVDEKMGHIHKIGEGKIIDDLGDQKTHRDFFLSNLSLGYHPQMLMSYESKKSKKSSFFNKILYSLEGIKKFCCVGSPTMKSSTGIVKVDFCDEKGSHEIMKEFRDYVGDEEMDLMESKKGKNRRKILSMVASNIDRFHGEKLDIKDITKMNDGKLELLGFGSMNQFQKISSVSGELKLKLSPQNPVYMKVNDTCYRLEAPLELTIKHDSKLRVIINKETLSC